MVIGEFLDGARVVVIVSVRVEIPADALEVLRQVVIEELIGMGWADSCGTGGSVDLDCVVEASVAPEDTTHECSCARVLGEEEDVDMMDVDASKLVR